MTVRALILAGGSGTRLWPASTDSHPKPFLALAGEKSLLVQTFERAATIAGAENVLISGRRSHAELIRRELPMLPAERLVLEPERRNTAPAIALAALIAAESDPEGVLIVLPSDQAVTDEGAFLAALRTAVDAALSRGAFVTLGIPPTRPETGFGYLEAEGEGDVRRVVRFVEKPTLEAAKEHLAKGTFLWNAGIFVFRTALLFAEMERLCPDVLAAARRAFAVRGDEASFAEAFASSRSVSIDYAVMEKARDVLTVPCACGWSDLGSWEAVYELRGGVDGGNVVTGPGQVFEGGGSLVLASGKPIRVVGLSDVVVVDAPEGILVMRRGASDALRRSVEKEIAR